MKELETWVGFACECGVDLRMLPVEPGRTYRMQHGPNPEHVSPTYEADGMGAKSLDWRKAVHERMKERV